MICNSDIPPEFWSAVVLIAFKLEAGCDANAVVASESLLHMKHVVFRVIRVQRIVLQVSVLKGVSEDRIRTYRQCIFLRNLYFECINCFLVSRRNGLVFLRR